MCMDMPEHDKAKQAQLKSTRSKRRRFLHPTKQLNTHEGIAARIPTRACDQCSMLGEGSAMVPDGHLGSASDSGRLAEATLLPRTLRHICRTSVVTCR